MAFRHAGLALLVLTLLLPTKGRADYDYAPLPPKVVYPQTAKAWGPHEFLAVEAILRMGALESYPRLTSAKTRDVFLRMIDGGPLARVTDERTPVLSRLIELRMLGGYIGCYRARYNVEVQEGAPLQPELVRLQSYQLELSALAVEMTEPFVASLEEEELIRLRQAGFFNTFGTLRTNFWGAIASLSEVGVYSPTDRQALAQAVRRTFPRLRRIFAADQRERIAAELTRLADRAETPTLRQALTEAAGVVAAP
jgi:hypothetical protein